MEHGNDHDKAVLQRSRLQKIPRKLSRLHSPGRSPGNKSPYVLTWVQIPSVMIDFCRESRPPPIELEAAAPKGKRPSGRLPRPGIEEIGLTSQQAARRSTPRSHAEFSLDMQFDVAGQPACIGDVLPRVHVQASDCRSTKSTISDSP